MKTRHEEKYQIGKSNGKRYANSDIPKMLQLLNKEYKEQKLNLNKLKKSILSPTNFACTRIYCWDNKPIDIILRIRNKEYLKTYFRLYLIDPV